MGPRSWSPESHQQHSPALWHCHRRGVTCSGARWQWIEGDGATTAIWEAVGLEEQLRRQGKQQVPG